MTPKFSVGEVCIIQSPTFPEWNGEAEILEVYEPLEVVGGLEPIAMYTYLTDKSEEFVVLETSLRKKHDPSQYNFHELMDNIKDMATA